MKLFVQQGYGKGTKIHQALSNGAADGVILSPRDDTEDNLRTFRKELFDDYSKSEVLLDPQFYYTTYIDGTTKNLPNYAYYPGHLTMPSFRSIRDIQKYAEDTIDFQMSLGAHYILSPTLLINSFSDRQTQICLSLAEESNNVMISKGYTQPLLTSLIFTESALNETDRVNEFLNEISVFDMEGFYLTVARNNKDYNQDFDSDLALSNLLYFIYSLSEINEFKVIVGYADIIGLLYLCVGAYGIGTGWHNSSRKFTIQQRILPSTGGRLPRERYTSVPLLNSILVSELDSIAANAPQSIFRDTLSNTSEDRIILAGSNPSDAWSRALSHQQHWSAIKKASNDIFQSTKDITTRLNNMEKAISHASSLYTLLERYAVQLERASSKSHLNTWLSAIRLFRGAANV
ncbi:hypothetical protein NDK47_23915 [Brevibacillus ruminantium]|uniref:Uncharacterized protein n=1 Tax=Brevibacillus ruminantium TaxID=2950604 RepID=A0ABY4WDJ6_9BACL|nr:hypothetical protein [Brevibacillus ruminantium]USG65133.1 hypothetical protein NDK47_23915 [Brevibacillus ruminantium]